MQMLIPLDPHSRQNVHIEYREIDITERRSKRRNAVIDFTIEMDTC